MKNIPELFGSMVFSDAVMRERLPAGIYGALKETARQSAHLDLETANVIAETMKDWAVEKGATHFAHWFQPMTGITAGKLDSFIAPAEDGRVIMEFSGSSLVRGEPDASSLPSGGLRATFEARGYTVWDTSSYAFIKDGALMIPTVFCSYSGEALDKKTPLLRSMEAIDRQARRILALFGETPARRVVTTAGPEQEYFLIDKAGYLKRPDLVYTGRTLFGARPPKGQEMEDHYFGCLKPRVSAFMKELDEELWKLGVYAKTKHNETAPAQHELAPVFTATNTATDHNQLTMELMKSIADKHGLACLLHEKPFAGVNGSGKHINWSLASDTGVNLLEPGETPYENAQFLLFLMAVIKAVDEYQDLLRTSVASAGNDCRLGANEAPPAIVSMFLGDELTEILEALESGAEYCNKEKCDMEIGVTVLPHFPKDVADRNRTSPFAFTGNRFEFRMPGSSFSVAEPNIVLNTAVAEVLRGFADELEAADDFTGALAALARKTIGKHKRIIFNGNSYSEEWQAEAARRGLSSLKTAVDAFPSLISPKSVELFARHQVYSRSELSSRHEILMEGYCKTLHIEALTMTDLVKGGVIPAVIAGQNEAAKLLKRKKACGGFNCSLEEHLLTRLSNLSARLLDRLTHLEETVSKARPARAEYYRDAVLPAMTELRAVADELETLTAKTLWPLPSYAELLHSVI
ncbi:MAG: glutamine synthetase III [Oscillospiraceae bacterium]|nr:glutamine synthetase III [Oscillospiraceae bacterium]